MVVEPASILKLTQGDKLLYVALTRTVHNLDVVLSDDKIPAMLAEFIEGEKADEPEPTSMPDQQHESASASTLEEEETAPEHSTLGEDVPVRGPQVTKPQSSDSGQLKPMLERMAHNLADEFFEVLREVGPNVQQRVVDLLWDKLEGNDSSV